MQNVIKEAKQKLMGKTWVEKVRIRMSELQVYGKMPNSNYSEWWFVCYANEVEQAMNDGRI